MKIVQLAINSVSTTVTDLPEALRGYREAGFENVEFALGQVKEWLKSGGSLKGLRGQLDSLGQRCIGGFETNMLSFSTPEECAANHAQIIENARILGELGSGTALVVGTDYIPFPDAGQQPLEKVAETVAGLAEQTSALDVSILIEFNWGFVKSLQAAAWVIRQSGAKNAGILFDPAHYHCTPSKAEHLTAEVVALIKHVHVNNMAHKPAELSHCNDDRLLPDEDGAVDIRDLFQRIEHHGYKGLFSIEMFSQELWKLPADEAARRMYQSLLPLCGDHTL